MAAFIDLSFPLGGDIAIVPGHPQVEYKLIHNHEEHYRTNATLFFSVHVGTHVDPPYHFDPRGPTIDQFPLEKLMGPGFIFNLRGKIAPGTAVQVKDLTDNNVLPPGGLAGRIAIVNTDWARRMYYSADYYKNGPYLAPETARWFVDQGVHGVGLDHPPDPGASGAPRAGDCPVHRTLLGNGVFIIENLANIETIPVQDPTIVAFPVKIYRGCGAPARVVAIIP
jgi:arylformamidase